MGSQKEQLEFIVDPQLSYGQLCEIAGRNENSVRNWIRDYLQNVGYKKDSGRMLYSGLDAIKISIFGHLVIDLSIPPGSAKVVTLGASSRIRGLAMMSKAQAKKVRQQPRFMVVDAMNDDWGSGSGAATFTQVCKRLEKTETPLLVIPIDKIIWRAIDRLVDVVTVRLSVTKMKKEVAEYKKKHENFIAAHPDKVSQLDERIQKTLTELQEGLAKTENRLGS